MRFLAKVVLILVFGAPVAFGQSSSFSYQGRLMQNGQAVNGSCDLVFSLYDSQVDGKLFGSSVTNLQTPISNGVFTVALDFGLVFDGTPRWLEISARGSSAEAFGTLSPRQLIGTIPHAITSYSLSGPGMTAVLASTQSNVQAQVNQAVSGLVSSNDVAVKIQMAVNGLATTNALASQVQSVSQITHSGIWLEHAGTSFFFGTNATGFRDAYKNATNGDTILLGPGLYSLEYFELNKSVGIIGSGSGSWDAVNSRFVGGTILEGMLSPQPGFSNCCLRHFSVQNGKDVMFFGLDWTYKVNCILEDLALGCTTHSNTHNIEMSGDGFYVNGLRSYNAGFNGIVFKGATNVVARNLYSWHDAGPAVYIKASSIMKGNSGNIDIDGVQIENSKFFIQAAEEPSVVSGVCVRNVHIHHAFGFWIEAYANSRLENVTVKDAVIDGGWLATIVGRGGPGMRSVLFSDCQVMNYPDPQGGPIFVFSSFPADAAQVAASNCRLGSTRFDGSGPTVRETSYIAQTNGSWGNSISLGVPSGQVQAMVVSNGLLYCVWGGKYPMSTGSLMVGDPVWISGGAASGVYKLLSFGDSSAANQPVAGAQQGDHWLALSTTNVDGVLEHGDILPGKVVGRLTGQQYQAVCDMTVSAAHSVGNTLESSSTRFFVQGTTANNMTLSPFGKASVYQTTTQLVPVYAWVWNASSQGQQGTGVLIGVFGGAVSTAGWYPSFFYGAGIELKSTGFPVYIAPANQW